MPRLRLSFERYVSGERICIVSDAPGIPDQGEQVWIRPSRRAEEAEYTVHNRVWHVGEDEEIISVQIYVEPIGYGRRIWSEER